MDSEASPISRQLDRRNAITATVNGVNVLWAATYNDIAIKSKLMATKQTERKQLIARLNEIDKQAFEWAQAVTSDPAARIGLEEQSGQLADELVEIAEKLRANPDWPQRPLQISESMLDLGLVRRQTAVTSVRIGDWANQRLD